LNAESSFPVDFRLLLDGFRIVAPFTFQGASFEKNAGSDAGAIVYGKALNLGDESLFAHDTSFSLKIR
jgi:hypothetical protein